MTTQMPPMLPIGRHICPCCNGGQSMERSFVVWQAADDRLVGHCKRASCGVWQFERHYPTGYPEKSSHMASPSVLRPYTDWISHLPLEMVKQFGQRYGFPPPDCLRMGGRFEPSTDKQRYLVPILAPNGSERGYMEMLLGSIKYRKIWKAKLEPMISWTPGGDYYDGVYLVEDQISALKLHHVASVRACALLGTSLNAESVAEIQRNARHVTIALDADATAKAFLLARKWGNAFKSCQVQILTKDFKDQSPTEIVGMMKDAGHIPVSSGAEFAGSL